MSAPFVWIFVCFSAGILCSRVSSISPLVLIPCFAVSWIAAQRTRAGIGICSSLLVIFILGLLFSQKKNEGYDANELRRWVVSHEREVASLAGRVTHTPEISRDYFALQVEVESVSGIKVNGVGRFTVSGVLSRPLHVNDRIRTFARLRLPRNFRTPGAFDYEQYLRGQQIHVLGSIKSEKLIHVLERSNSFRTLISAVRLHWIRSTISIFPREDAGLLRALWLDDRGGLSQAQERILMDAGIFHVIAISGFHISVLLLLLFLALKRFVSFRIAILIACFWLLVYFLILEGRSSVTRAFLSFLILSFAVWRHEQIHLPNWICLSAWVQLVFNPHELYDAGFQLTYLSTASILFLVIPLCKKFRMIPKLYRYCLDFLVTGAIVQLVLIPYQLYIFHRIPLYTFFANVIAVPLSSVLIASSTVLMPFSFAARLLAFPVRKMLSALMNSALLCAEEGVRIIPAPPFALILAFYAAILAGILISHRGFKLSFLLASAAILLLILLPSGPKPSGAFQVHFLDVGQGDSILLQYPDGTFDLLDGGGFFNLEAMDTGQSIILPYLSRLRVTKLNRVFLTHAHADHMNGLISLMKYMPVSRFYVTRQPVGVSNYQQFLRSINRTPVSVHSGLVFEQAGVRLQVLSPADSRKTNRVANDDSLVLLATYHGRSILLTGDVEVNAEKEISLKIKERVDYIKVPHHGSKTSSSEFFLNRLKPKIAFISVGRNNWFGHPHPDVLRRYKQKHSMLYRTDRNGTIILRIDNSGTEVFPYSET